MLNPNDQINFTKILSLNNFRVGMILNYFARSYLRFDMIQ